MMNGRPQEIPSRGTLRGAHVLGKVHVVPKRAPRSLALEMFQMLFFLLRYLAMAIELGETCAEGQRSCRLFRSKSSRQTVHRLIGQVSNHPMNLMQILEYIR